MISDKEAQQIASDWHGGGGSALYQFSSTGAIVPGLLAEIADNLQYEIAQSPENHDNVAELRNLRAYVEHHGERGQVADWYRRVICAS